MTSKRGVEAELDKLSDDVLPSLPSEYRLKMTMEAWASGDEETHERLKDTAPMKEYRVTDPEFSDALNASLVLSLKAWFDLQTGRWRFLYEKRDADYKQLLHQEHGDEWDWVEEPPEDDLFFEKSAMKAAAHFLKDYLAYDRFAEEELGVSLETFLGVAFPDAPVDPIENVAQLADGRMFDDHEYKENPDGVPDYDPDEAGWGSGVSIEWGGEEFTAEEAAEVKYEQLLDAWENGAPVA